MTATRALEVLMTELDQLPADRKEGLLRALRQLVHDLRTPLAVVRMEVFSAGSVVRGCAADFDPERSGELHAALENADRAAARISSLLDAVQDFHGRG